MSRYSDLILVAIVIPATLFFFIPAHSYYVNILEMRYNLSEILPVLAAAVLLASIAILAMLAFARKVPWGEHLLKIFVVSIVCFSICMWLQAYILQWRYGFYLDGNSFDWGSKKLYGDVDIAAWCAVILLCSLFSRWVYGARQTIVLMIIGAQALSLAIIGVQTYKPGRLKYVNDGTEFVFSSDKNVIILVLDAFEAHAFEYLKDNDPGYASIFNGFTYFPNALGSFSTTYLSVPFLLTGKVYDNTKTVQQFKREAYLSDSSLPLMLRRQGYHTYLPDGKIYLITHPDINSALKKHEYSLITNRDDIKQMLLLAIFRAAPQFVKIRIFDEITRLAITRTSGLLTSESFAENFKKESRVGMKQPAFKYYHLVGLHPVNLADMFYLDKYDSRRHKRGAEQLRSVKVIIDRLKKLGIYDNTAIIIAGDHGRPASTPENFYLFQSDLEMSLFVPLILIKPFGAQGELKVSYAPVSQGDIPATVAAMTDPESPDRSKSMFAMSDTMMRSRYFYAHDRSKHKEVQSLDYRPPLVEYLVYGNSWNIDSWSKTGRVFRAPMDAVDKLDIPRYGLSEQLLCGKYVDAYCSKVAYRGWGNNTLVSIMALSNRASMRFTDIPQDNDYVLSMYAAPVTPQGIRQRIYMKASNGKPLGSIMIDKGATYRFVIPSSVVSSNGEINLEFEFPDAVKTADSLGDYTSIQLGWIKISKLDSQ